MPPSAMVGTWAGAITALLNLPARSFTGYAVMMKLNKSPNHEKTPQRRICFGRRVCQGHIQIQHPESPQTHSIMHPKVLLQIRRG